MNVQAPEPLKMADLLSAQIKAVSDQVVHWDNFFWSKSSFFMAVESAGLLGIAKVYADHPGHLSQAFSVMFVVAALLNLYLCLVWLRTARRNRDFLNMRFQYGAALERALKNPDFCLYTYQDWKRNPQNQKMSGPESHHLEIKIPIAFAIVWLLILACVFVTLTVDPGTPSKIAAAFRQTTLFAWIVWSAFIALLTFSGWECRHKIPKETGARIWSDFQRSTEFKQLLPKADTDL
jgi:hypothetical protein